MKRNGAGNGSNGRSRRTVLLGLGGAAAVGLAGCLGGDGDSGDGDSDGEDASTDATGDDGGDSSPPPTSEPTADGSASLDLRLFPPSHNRESFRSLSVAYESVVLTTTAGEEISFPIGRSASLVQSGSPSGLPVVDDLALPAGEYESVAVHYAIEEAITTDGGPAEIEFTSPESVNVAARLAEPPVIEADSPWVVQTHFALLSEPWNLSIPTIILGPGIPD